MVLTLLAGGGKGGYHMAAQENMTSKRLVIWVSGSIPPYIVVLLAAIVAAFYFLPWLAWNAVPRLESVQQLWAVIPHICIHIFRLFLPPHACTGIWPVRPWNIRCTVGTLELTTLHHLHDYCVRFRPRMNPHHGRLGVSNIGIYTILPSLSRYRVTQCGKLHGTARFLRYGRTFLDGTPCESTVQRFRRRNTKPYVEGIICAENQTAIAT